MRGLPWSVSAHAKDIWTTPDWEKREKLLDADWAVTCTRAGCEHLAALARRARSSWSITASTSRAFRRAAPPGRRATGHATDDPVVILSVGRAVAKKGYDDLLEALALPAAQPALALRAYRRRAAAGAAEAQAARDSASPTASPGAARRPQDAVLAAYREADLFVLAAASATTATATACPTC